MFKKINSVNKFLSLLCLAFLLLSLAIGVAFIPFQTISLFINKTYDPAVVLMFEKNEDGYNFRCTATAFDKVPDGYLFVSASHCVDDSASIFLGGDKLNDTLYPAEVIAYGDQKKKYDFSVLKVKAPKGTFTILPIGNNPSQKGEHIFSISAPDGIGKAYMEGYISMLDIPTSQPIDDDDWQHNVLFDMLGEGPGSSGSTIVCADQMKACAILIGHVPGGMVAEPIERFKQWWADVQSGKIEKLGPKKKPVPAFSFPLPFPIK